MHYILCHKLVYKAGVDMMTNTQLHYLVSKTVSSSIAEICNNILKPTLKINSHPLIRIINLHLHIRHGITRTT